MKITYNIEACIGIGERISEYREKKELSQERLIEKLKEKGFSISRGTLIKIEHGELIGDSETFDGRSNTATKLDLRLVLALCDIFECDMNYLLFGGEPFNSLDEQIKNNFGFSQNTIEYLSSNSNTQILGIPDIFGKVSKDETFSYAFNDLVENYSEFLEVMLFDIHKLKSQLEKSKDKHSQNRIINNYAIHLAVQLKNAMIGNSLGKYPNTTANNNFIMECLSDALRADIGFYTSRND